MGKSGHKGMKANGVASRSESGLDPHERGQLSATHQKTAKTERRKTMGLPLGKDLPQISAGA